ncbi:hypothetical protein [uncultured Draconibacterium sp.]|uniref:hypothetical protein n=1 Tax=uncultured Draconibacterium sp. TaxID=1573823 RepID=UPI0029C93C78|nr:hypothetical protein [uncultured Draconibacterium sp.]
MKLFKPIVGIILGLCAWGTNAVFAQSGDQILDGIGETGLIARYTLEENAKDWSRNNLHGTIHGSDYKFVDDEIFGKVISLSGDGETYISIPGELLAGEESLSISGWIFPLSKTAKHHCSTLVKTTSRALWQPLQPMVLRLKLILQPILTPLLLMHSN